ncbi:MAG: hypothetical protein KDA66_09115 [Planctomycetaceae bacterium]|nr:hypothetical protein [Planctomycetaceae bacterium]
MRIAFHCVSLVIGLYLICQGAIGFMDPAAVYSDLKAFESRVAEDPSARHVLANGGESDQAELEDIIDDVILLSDNGFRVAAAGLLLSVFAIGGILFENGQKRDAKEIAEM